MLSLYVALPCIGHLEQLYGIFAYLKCHHNARKVFEPSHPEINYNDFKVQDWIKMYSKYNKIIPSNVPDSPMKEFS